MTRAEYVAKMAPYAARVSAATNVPTGVLLAQWDLETEHGNSRAAVELNNHAGINYASGSISSGKDATTNYAVYASLEQFADDAIRVYHLSYYDDVRAAGDVMGAIRALGASPWAESHYAYTAAEAAQLGLSPDVVGLPGQLLNDVYYAGQLGQYEGQTYHAPATGTDTAKLVAIGTAFLALMALTSRND